jgi:hypothetical protein
VGAHKSPATGPFAALRQRLSGRHAPEPTHPPIEEVAASLRRLRAMLNSLPKGTSWVRSVGVANAYDQMLAVACEQLEVDNRLLSMTHGRLRDLERLRVEYELGECGLLL